MPECVRTDLLRESQSLEPPGYEPAHATICQSPTHFVNEKRVRPRAQQRALPKVRAERPLRGSAKWNDTFFSPFAQYSDEASCQVKFGNVESDEFRTADASAVEELQDGASPQAIGCICIDFYELRR